jgi:hypothetical protein
MTGRCHSFRLLHYQSSKQYYWQRRLRWMGRVCLSELQCSQRPKCYQRSWFFSQNTADLKYRWEHRSHSTAHFWNSAAAFYFGGSLLFKNGDGALVYNAGRDNASTQRRKPLAYNPDTAKSGTFWNVISNSKVYQAVANVGLGSWSGEMEVLGFECHECGMSMEALAADFWVNDMAAVCRTGDNLVLPNQDATKVGADGFKWYDTGQEHIISNAEFRNCGYWSDEFAQYDASVDRGCGDDPLHACHWLSSIWGLLSHSDAFLIQKLCKLRRALWHQR